MSDFRNEFSWSVSRKKKFDTCLRAYYYNHYGFWGGWDRNGDPNRRHIYLLKQMTGLDAWAGSIVHDVIETALHDLKWGRLVSIEHLQTRAREMMIRGWRESLNKDWQFDPKSRTNLFEHYYEDDNVDRRSVEIRDRVNHCLANFRRSSTYARLQALAREDWLAVEELESFDVDGVPIWVKMDCAYREDGKLVIIDWKTGRPHPNDRTQLEVYALYASTRWPDTAIEDLVLRPVYLNEESEADQQVSKEDLDDLKAAMKEGVSAMKALLADADENEARVEDFPMVEGRQPCGRCNFRELCDLGPIA